MAKAAALFYPLDLSELSLVQLVAGILEDEALDLVSFAGETGGSAERELAIPFLPAMDEVVVDAARLRLEARSMALSVTDFAETKSSDGLIVSLPEKALLSRVVIDEPELQGTKTRAQLHAVIRPAEPKGAGFEPGPPIFASPDFGLGPLYGRVLSGLTVSEVTEGRLQLAIPPTSGRAWLIQFADGDGPTELQPVGFDSAVRSVTIDAAARNLTLVAVAADGGETLLWSYADALLPAAGIQTVEFAPVAQKLLSDRLAALGDAKGNVTLPIRLVFRSESAGTIAILERTLDTRYRVRPLGAGPAKVELRGGWTPVRLEAPAGLRPGSGSSRLTARHLGRELNPGSPEPAIGRPLAGVRVTPTHWAAAPVPFLPAPPAAAGSTLPLVGARLYLSSSDDGEAVVELRGDVAGVPGDPLGPPSVRQLPAGTSDWVDFDPPQPISVVTGPPVWLTLRSNRGELLWFGAGGAGGRISSDGGVTWGEVDPLLVPASTPLAQLFHDVEPPFTLPRILIHRGETRLAELVLDQQLGTDGTEFGSSDDALPPALLDVLAAAPGSRRVTTEVSLFSRTALDLSVQGAELSYSPFGAE
jgi:hypothetical protein